MPVEHCQVCEPVTQACCFVSSDKCWFRQHDWWGVGVLCKIASRNLTGTSLDVGPQLMGPSLWVGGGGGGED